MTKITVGKAAKMLGMNLTTLSTLLQQGKMPFGTLYRTKTGKVGYLIYEEEVKKYIKTIEYM